MTPSGFFKTLVPAVFLATSAFAADTAQLVQDNSAFAFALYHQLDTTEGNLFFSPYSISLALAMSLAGARGETESQIARALHFSLPPDKTNSAFAALDQVQADKNVTLSVANSIWISNRAKLFESYVALLKKDYGVSITSLDFTEAEKTSHIINQWVEKKTQNKIHEIVSPDIINSQTKLVLANAIYFYGKWAHSFEANNTSPMDFQVSSQKAVKMPMMSQESNFAYADLGSFEMVELPYEGDTLSMLVLLPKSTNGLPSLESTLSAEKLVNWRHHLKEVKVSLHLPKFKFSWENELTSVFQKLGMTEAFTDHADFTGITRSSLKISAIAHAAFISVAEKGTEAAAATGLSYAVAGIELPRPINFTADHPFLFLIQDNKTGTILFLGRLADPSAGA